MLITGIWISNICILGIEPVEVNFFASSSSLWCTFPLDAGMLSCGMLSCCYGLRKKKNFKIPRVKTENARNSTRLRGPNIWNSLDDPWKELSYMQLKKKVSTEKNKIYQIDFKKGTLVNTNRSSNFIYY